MEMHVFGGLWVACICRQCFDTTTAPLAAVLLCIIAFVHKHMDDMQGILLSGRVISAL